LPSGVLGPRDFAPLMRAVSDLSCDDIVAEGSPGSSKAKTIEIVRQMKINSYGLNPNVIDKKFTLDDDEHLEHT
jgi:hypothetical protein